MMFILFKPGKNENPTDVEEGLLKTRSAVKGGSLNELAKKYRDSGSDTKEGRSKEETETGMKKSKKGVEEQPKKPSEQSPLASTPIKRETKTSKRSGEPKFAEKGSPIDVFEKSPSNDSGLKEEVEGEEWNSSEEASLREEPFTVVSKKDIEEIQKKTWDALEFLKD